MNGVGMQNSWTRPIEASSFHQLITHFRVRFHIPPCGSSNMIMHFVHKKDISIMHNMGPNGQELISITNNNTSDLGFR